MIKDEIRNPERLGTADSIISGKYGGGCLRHP